MKFRVQELAEAQGLDAAKLARRADLNYTTVAQFFDPEAEAKLNPKASTLKAIARVLGVDLGELFADDVDDSIRVPESLAGVYTY